MFKNEYYMYIIIPLSFSQLFTCPPLVSTKCMHFCLIITVRYMFVFID